MTELTTTKSLREEYLKLTKEQPMVTFSIECDDGTYFSPQKVIVPAVEYMKHLEQQVIALRSRTEWHEGVPEEIGLYLCTFNFSHYELMDYRYGEWREWDCKLERYTKTHDAPSHFAYLPKEQS
jgi:hypothetical protein